MSAVLRIPALGFEHAFASSEAALAKAQAIRDAYPTLDVLVDISDGDGLDIPEFLREATIARAKRGLETRS